MDAPLENHTRTCSSCSKKIQKIMLEDNSLEDYLTSFRASAPIEKQLRSELIDTFKNLNFEVKSQKVSSFSKFKESFLLNSTSFVRNLLSPVNCALIAISVVSYLLFTI